MAKKKTQKGPTVHIIAGPNGSGKTTFAREFLPYYAHCKEFVNADLLAQGISPFAPEKLAIRAGRIMIARINELAAKQTDFAFETTLSGRTYLNLIRSMKKRDYNIHLYFLWIPSVQMAIERVADRVKNGGHNIPQEVIRRRFKAGQGNFFSLYRSVLDSWILFDNSAQVPRIIARTNGKELEIADNLLYNRIIKGLK